MIITKIQGGLGNQIFQWAYGKALSIKFNTDLYLDTSFYNNQTGNTFRIFELNKFPNLGYHIPNIEEKPTIQLNDNFTYNEFSYDDNFNYYLNGFWQSEKYFLDVSNTIKLALQPSIDVYEKLKIKTTNNSVSLHIRRTDYVTSNGFHPVQSIEYYNKALDIIGNYDQLLIFSDDIDWCKNNLQFKNMVFIENQNTFEDIWLMSLCKHNIIANSSFSWWGAWLNKKSDKIVIAPNDWFGPNSNLNTSNIVPQTWIKL
jgi:hypothetical protein